MPTREQHLAQAERNQRFMESLLSDPNSPLEWAATVLFYQAVHLGRAVVAHRQLPPVRNHPAFEMYLRRDLDAPSDVYDAYRMLKDESERGRYDCKAFTQEEVRSLLTSQFEMVRAWALGELGIVSPVGQ